MKFNVYNTISSLDLCVSLILDPLPHGIVKSSQGFQARPTFRHFVELLDIY